MLWDDFLNSDYHDWRGTGWSEDRLDKPGWLARWLDEYGLPNPGIPSPDELGELKRMRSDMLRIVQSLIAGESLSPSDMDNLNAILSEGSVRYRLIQADGGFRLETSPSRADWNGVRAQIAASFARMLEQGEPSRLRICGNPDCLWVYYDETKNRSKRYCDDKMCGNLMKVRRFRAKRKASQDVQGPETPSN
ncbi:CGNR zinc finger domain-containing protein [Cohnella caldifontis]|uniref:CGNR zinc finger domain-containing protein n=1 Tax=Cohnella caldifontis TaxID=3027471 RepID=UPI0023EAE370|nr:ABATE domain-containing protein [Cohnella sp. YIM B05605]